MRSHLFAMALLLVATLVPAAVATTGDPGASPRQQAIVNFAHPTRVATEILMGRYLVVHDDAKMARGEPCTSFYPLETPGDAHEEAVSFTCLPHTRPMVDRFTIATDWDTALKVYILTEYQFAGDTEGHRVPSTALAADHLPAPASVACVR
jgi:hypothetical protein